MGPEEFIGAVLLVFFPALLLDPAGHLSLLYYAFAGNVFSTVFPQIGDFLKDTAVAAFFLATGYFTFRYRKYDFHSAVFFPIRFAAGFFLGFATGYVFMDVFWAVLLGITLASTTLLSKGPDNVLFALAFSIFFYKNPLPPAILLAVILSPLAFKRAEKALVVSIPGFLLVGAPHLVAFPVGGLLAERLPKIERVLENFFLFTILFACGYFWDGAGAVVIYLFLARAIVNLMTYVFAGGVFGYPSEKGFEKVFSDMAPNEAVLLSTLFLGGTGVVLAYYLLARIIYFLHIEYPWLFKDFKKMVEPHPRTFQRKAYAIFEIGRISGEKSTRLVYSISFGVFLFSLFPWLGFPGIFFISLAVTALAAYGLSILLDLFRDYGKYLREFVSPRIDDFCTGIHLFVGYILFVSGLVLFFVTIALKAAPMFLISAFSILAGISLLLNAYAHFIRETYMWKTYK